MASVCEDMSPAMPNPHIIQRASAPPVIMIPPRMTADEYYGGRARSSTHRSEDSGATMAEGEMTEWIEEVDPDMASYMEDNGPQVEFRHVMYEAGIMAQQRRLGRSVTDPPPIPEVGVLWVRDSPVQEGDVIETSRRTRWSMPWNFLRKGKRDSRATSVDDHDEAEEAEAVQEMADFNEWRNQVHDAEEGEHSTPRLRKMSKKLSSGVKALGKKIAETTQKLLRQDSGYATPNDETLPNGVAVEDDVGYPEDAMSETDSGSLNGGVPSDVEVLPFNDVALDDVQPLPRRSPNVGLAQVNGESSDNESSQEDSPCMQAQPRCHSPYPAWASHAFDTRHHRIRRIASMTTLADRQSPVSPSVCSSECITPRGQTPYGPNAQWQTIDLNQSDFVEQLQIREDKGDFMLGNIEELYGQAYGNHTTGTEQRAAGVSLRQKAQRDEAERHLGKLKVQCDAHAGITLARRGRSFTEPEQLRRPRENLRLRRMGSKAVEWSTAALPA